MASIHPNGSGFRVHYERDGRRLKSPTMPTHDLAAAWIREHLPAVRAASMIDLIGLWEQDEPSDYRHQASIYLCKAAVREGWGDPTRLNGGDLAKWSKDIRSPRYGQYLVTVLQWAVDAHRLPIRADALEWRPKKYGRKPPMPLLTDAQVDAVRNAARSYGRVAFAIVDYLLTYGARPITACRLTLADLDAINGDLVINDAKHSGGWRHVVHERHLEAWQSLHDAESKPTDPLFWHYREKRAWKIKNGGASELTNWYRNTIGKKLKLGKMNGIYHLKRYAITTMLRRNIDPATVALFTGHLDIEQVLTYAKSNADLQREALAKLLPASPASVPNEVPKFLNKST